MRIIFTFTDSPDLLALPKDDIYTTSLEIPDEAQLLSGYEQRILAIAEAVGRLTHASLHLSCTEIGRKNHPIKTTSEIYKPNAIGGLYRNWRTLLIAFERVKYSGRTEYCYIKILLPLISSFTNSYLKSYGQRDKRRKILARNLINLSRLKPSSDEEMAYTDALQTIEAQLLVLLNAEPSKNSTAWKGAGFHPWWSDSSLVTRFNNRRKKQAAEERKRERDEEKQHARNAKLAMNVVPLNTAPIPQTGAGRRPGAIPGVFKGVKFRSQLEIRFATELESRGIRWVYEIERLGEGQYLVDFYLPDYRCWVEVKGKFEPRDDYLLKDVASHLKERQERLFVFMQSKAFAISADTFTQLSRDQFWDQLNSAL